MPYKTPKEMLDGEYYVRTRKGTQITSEGARYLTSVWGFGGSSNAMPPAGTYLAGDLAGRVFDMGFTGAIKFRNAPDGSYNYITSFQRGNNAGNTANNTIIADRLWANTGLVVTGVTWTGTFNSLQWPPRDDSGLSTGYGVMIALECGVGTIQGPNIPRFTTIEYTNTDNQPYRTGYIEHFPSSIQAGTFFPMTMDIGDRGVKSVQKIELQGPLTGAPNQVTGTLHLVAYRPIVVINDYNYTDRMDYYNFGPKKVFNDSCLFYIIGTSLNGSSSQTIGLIHN